MDNELKDTLTNYILDNYNRYRENGYEIWLHNDYLRIKYNHKIYKAKIIKKEDKLYWHLTPYNKSYYLTEIKNYSTFESIIFAIKDNDGFN